MAAAEAIDHGRRRVVAHPRGAEQVPAGAHRMTGRARRAPRPPAATRAREPRGSRASGGSSRRAVAHLRAAGSPSASRRSGSSVTRLDSSGRSSAMMPQLDRPSETPAHPVEEARAPCVGGPSSGCASVDARPARPVAQAPLRAADEPARRVGLVELERLMYWPAGPVQRAEVLVEDADDGRERVHHQPPADQPADGSRGRRGGRGRRRAAAGAASRCRWRRARRPARPRVLAPVAVDVLDAGRAPVRSITSSRTRARVSSSTPSSTRRGQCVTVGGPLGAVRTALQAGPALDARARGPPAPVASDRVRRRPPVPAELVVGARHALARGPERHGRQRRARAGRERGVAGQPGDRRSRARPRS